MQYAAAAAVVVVVVIILICYLVPELNELNASIKKPTQFSSNIFLVSRHCDDAAPPINFHFDRFDWLEP